MTAIDAFWLGLIDEVLGATDLPLTRYLAEYQPDPEPAQPGQIEDQTSVPELAPSAVGGEASDQSKS